MGDGESGFALVGAVDWLQAVLLGAAGTIVAVIAVAAVGLLMLAGRLPARRGATVILGCFVLFGAGTIASGLVDAVAPEAVAPPPAAAAPSYRPTAPTPTPFDPYAGASVLNTHAAPIIR